MDVLKEKGIETGKYTIMSYLYGVLHKGKEASGKSRRLEMQRVKTSSSTLC